MLFFIQRVCKQTSGTEVDSNLDAVDDEPQVKEQLPKCAID